MRREADHPVLSGVPSEPTAFEVAWEALEPAFRQCLGLAWESCAAGSLGVGCVITDGEGEAIATGRNRLFEEHAGDDRLAGSPVAHAEMNALGHLRAMARYDTCTLWTSLEPCLLCAGGIRVARLGEVRFLATDPIWRHVSSVPELDPFIGEGWPEMDGPRDDEFAAFARLLPFHSTMFWSPDSVTARSWITEAPALGRLAADLIETNELLALASSHAPVEEVVGELWSRLTAAIGPQPDDNAGMMPT